MKKITTSRLTETFHAHSVRGLQSIQGFKSTQCPHCLQHFAGSYQYDPASKDVDSSWWVVGHTNCPACGRSILVLAKGSVGQGTHGQYFVVPGSVDQDRLIYPKGVSRAPIPPEVPEEFASNYKEACLVLPDSEKASAALSRRCLQHLLREKARVKHGDLASEIQQMLDSTQLPTHIAEDLDAVRHIGNFAAHPIKSTNTGEVVDVEPHEADWSLNVLEQLFDFYFVQPVRAKAKRDALNSKLQSAGKPPMKVWKP